MQVKGVIFDFNGTLLWDTHLHNQAWDQFLEKHKIALSDAEKQSCIHGKTNALIFGHIFQTNLSEEQIQKYSAEKELIYQKLCLESSIELAPGCISLFKHLKNIDIPYTIASSSPEMNIDFYFKHFNLELYFDRSQIVCDNGAIKSKPDPEIFLKAANVLSLAMKDILVFEDSETGIKAAENAGAGKIIIINSTGTRYKEVDHVIVTDFQTLNSDHLFE